MQNETPKLFVRCALKRFSAKEERRRVVAYVIEPRQLAHEHYGFENHLNVFHHNKRGLPSDLAHGLGLFLNSTIVDRYFRNFSEHTQVNASDLRAMRYPSKEMPIRFGKWARAQNSLSQEDKEAMLTALFKDWRRQSGKP